MRFVLIAKGRFFCNQNWSRRLVFSELNGDLGRIYFSIFAIRKILKKKPSKIIRQNPDKQMIMRLLIAKEPSLCNHFCFSFPFNKCESSRPFCGGFAPITCQSHVPTGGWNFAGGSESALSIMHYELSIMHCALCIKKKFSNSL